MRLYLIRHGDAIDQIRGGVQTDAERWLTDEGREEVGWTAQLLTTLNVQPDLILSSPLVRARQTAEIIADTVALDSGVEISEHLVHGGSFSGILNDIGTHNNPRHVVLAGHMPSIGQLVGWLCWNERHTAVRMRTAGIACIDLPDAQLGPGNGDLRWLLPSKTSRKLLGQ